MAQQGTTELKSDATAAIEPPRGMSRWQAGLLEMMIIALCIVALVLVFQPYSLRLFSIGAVLVIVGGLAFNLVPFCRPGIPFSQVLRVAGIVVILLIVIAALAIGSAWAYGRYITGG